MNGLIFLATVMKNAIDDNKTRNIQNSRRQTKIQNTTVTIKNHNPQIRVTFYTIHCKGTTTGLLSDLYIIRTSTHELIFFRIYYL